MAGSSPPSSSSTLAIELLPEFGWSIQGQPAFGPGSVFQGFVRVSPSEPTIQADQIRLSFQAIEAVRPIEISAGIVSNTKRQQLFGVQHIMWKGETLGAERLPFTIQLPLVQYPPSVEDHEYYQCTFRLTATIERVVERQRSVVGQCHRDILYRPFIETCALKNPLETSQQELRVQALDYVPGDSISVRVLQSLPQGSSVTLSLYQRSRLYAIADVPELTQLVTSEKWHDASHLPQLTLALPRNLLPSLGYSPMLSISYHLKITIKQRRRHLWATTGPTYEYPINIGTLGYGVRAPDALQVYSALSQEQLRQEQPKYMEAVQYEDSLPAYDPTRLPSYGYATLVS
ncbi:hypothetical protein RO3G_08211 [Lichtheimia corymbifera JMRC:FSU:9682]|uniref:Arrestin C-terminal-like domain-containing protein n=1 Tax=Lichtheimia corymbifera JMRC:FSU:9682 TaxID=1263082 RepID=A0A068RLQ0_9FUNG|nr:hypothetical protein RO3G_08211 [Lichtheimia corymbifera JMRC:FSU:9682]